MIPYFAYANYCDPEKISALTSGAPFLSESKALGWEIVFLEKGLATLQENETSSTKGSLFRFRESDWEAMDHYMEKLGPYQRVGLWVTYWGEKIQAETYLIPNEETQVND